MEFNELKLQIIDLIAHDELDKAVKLLKENLPMNHPKYVSLIMQMRRLNDLRNKTNNATIAFNEATMERNKISQSLIEMTQTLSEPPPPSSPPPKENYSDFPEVEIDTPNFESETPLSPPPKYQDALLDDDDDFYDEDEFEDDFHSSSGALRGYQNEIFYKGSPALKEKTIILNLDYDLAFLKCVQAVNYNGFTMKQQNQSMGYLEATSGMSIWSWGEKILIYLKELEGHKTYVHIYCDSALKTTVTSWGRNNQNIDKILTILRQA